MPGFSEATSDTELLAYLLGPQADKAGQLLARFGSFGHAIAAEAIALQAEGVADEPRTMFHAVREAARRLALCQVIVNRPVLSQWTAVLDYCRTTLAHEPREQVRILFLDRRNMLIADEQHTLGSVGHAPVYPREAMKRAMVLNASAIIVLHNHPSGDPTPSRDDIVMTQEIVAAGKALGVEVHDHIVFGASGHASFRALGLL